MQLPDPTHMTLHDWADATMYVVSQSSHVQHLQDEDWQRWGLLFRSIPGFDVLGVPNPYDFSDWVDWATRLADALANYGNNTNLAGTSPTAAFIISQLGLSLTDQTGNFLVTQ